MRKHWMLILPLVAIMSACGSGSFETEDIEENTATAADPKTKTKALWVMSFLRIRYLCLAM